MLMKSEPFWKWADDSLQFLALSAFNEAIGARVNRARTITVFCPQIATQRCSYADRDKDRSILRTRHESEKTLMARETNTRVSSYLPQEVPSDPGFEFQCQRNLSLRKKFGERRWLLRALFLHLAKRSIANLPGLQTD